MAKMVNPDMNNNTMPSVRARMDNSTVKRQRITIPFDEENLNYIRQTAYWANMSTPLLINELIKLVRNSEVPLLNYGLSEGKITTTRSCKFGLTASDFIEPEEIIKKADVSDKDRKETGLFNKDPKQERKTRITITIDRRIDDLIKRAMAEANKTNISAAYNEILNHALAKYMD